eukprot:Protomagalhaensia_sp_Gyna_25__1923@NODE_201_length_4440_cov_35_914338_g155_i0_p1_GENE_NODE_201_length_4440_cov_35_914338_g155_i0NODE_201_length_4440_cov_35_914338_g155_i0_p1_ORF_typecomplete_len537_score76_15ANAPC4_WD40/PF12894_7/6_6e02ANAPC4_WD40/PF12894_7/30ANAPC4_WD40/PF12894_7/0_34ANAPC4_WD40/PF12894_7/1_4e03ANAPC4_WD40/PF12894_7/6_6e05ANAPC4_WD40/PF12894_7/3_9e05ANAPC4_WD40/PF12894_7/1_2e02WD40/PF00400_32/4_6e02WD40/PF00400_32/2e03WD40/PF00400_32/0_01WD40/PF00400_32/0_00031WD40/PF00400_32/4
MVSQHSTPLGHIDEQPTFTWYGPKGNPTAVAFESGSGNLCIGTSLGFVMFLSTNQTVPSCFQVSRMEKEVTVKSCLMNDKCAAAVTSDGTIKFFRVRNTNIKSGDINARVRQTLELTSAGAQTTVFRSVTKQELVQVATAQVDKVALKLLFLEQGKYIALLCTCGTLYVFSVDRALSHNEANGPVQCDWQLVLLGKPMAASTSGDGSLLAVALWPSADYPNTKFGTSTMKKASPRKTTPKSARVRPAGGVAFAEPPPTEHKAKKCVQISASADEKSTPQMPALASALHRGKSVRHIDEFTHFDPPRRTAQSNTGTSIRSDSSSHLDSDPGKEPPPALTSEEEDNDPQTASLPRSPTASSPRPALSDVSTIASPSPPAQAIPNEVIYEEKTIVPLIEIYEITKASHADGLKFICVLDSHSREISSVSLNKDGSLLASADLSREIRVTEIENQKELISSHWNYHSTRVSGLDWSPDGSKLVSASTNEVYIWDVDKPYSSVLVKDAQTGNVQFVRFIFNNTILVAGSDGVMKVYEVIYD